MTIQLILGKKIRSEVLKILSGEYFHERRPNLPNLYILSPWISDVIIEFADFYLSRELEKKYSFLFDYNIKSINLAHAILLLKLHHGVEVNIVTLPLNKMNISPHYLRKTETLLDFLDEIGCNVFVNSNLHSKLLLANDLALLGSFNLTSSALYHREEIGVNTDDIGNLDTLERYCIDVIHSSVPYGYSSSLRWGWILDEGNGKRNLSINKTKEIRLRQREKITRGWLLDEMLKVVYEIPDVSERYGEFFFVTSGYDKKIKYYSQNLTSLYFQSLKKLVSGIYEDYQDYQDAERSRNWVKSYFNYRGDETTDSIMKFLDTKFARRLVPSIRLRVESLE